MSGDHKVIRVGSRKSELALIQTRHVISLLKDCFPDKEFEIVTMSTLGDKVLDIALPKIGEKSLFTKELETALATDCVDFVVHSLKDLPTCLPLGMAIGAVLTREDPRDALVLRKGLTGLSLETLPENSIIGTSSLRRTAQLAKKYPHLIVENIRGNLNTRLKKLDDLEHYQAIILAAAGLKRIGWEERISKILIEDDLLYAVGQGALAVECRADNEEIINLLQPLYDLETALQVAAERSFLKTLGGGCSAPVAVVSNLKVVKENELDLYLKGAVWSLDGKEEVVGSDSISIGVKKDLRCAQCPYRTIKVKDIENLECIKCPVNSGEPSSKKPKLDDIPTELLKNDPHDKCPIQLPVGSDFMGKCPYLENKLATSEGFEPTEVEYAKCPFLQGEIMKYSENNALEQSTSDDKNLFCGLVIHKDATYEGMLTAKKLGEKLANNLIAKGALEVMSKAQAIIHNQQSVPPVTSS
ncbi:porphobilinogen deaminase [Diabrotica virgifera virgifera]|uniref:hydroxymethylbilane synthase n=1 Tax=Diabrotica virgifera virgifera TaxID=50390 RepID=A0A6P7GGM4_DIAVI|nr:porphobilinogen deaminase [Diabrotica virgifera virgifera]XP_028143065.1 porphobilinogen deaminase [Diabrotica virgifera virgifera]